MAIVTSATSGSNFLETLTLDASGAPTGEGRIAYKAIALYIWISQATPAGHALATGGPIAVAAKGRFTIPTTVAGAIGFTAGAAYASALALVVDEDGSERVIEWSMPVMLA
jgi:hypothetical protein